jgi:hypothetical protein
MSHPPDNDPSPDTPHDADLYMQPVSMGWSRAVGVVLLIAAVVLAALFGYGLIQRLSGGGNLMPATSSQLIFELMLVVIWAFCAQAGWRIVFSGSRRPGALFSWVVWLTLGAALFMFTAIIAVLRLQAAGAWTQRDLQVILFGGGIGGWCLWLAWKARGG